MWFRAVRVRRAVPGRARCRVHFTRRRLDLARCMARVGRSHVSDAGKSRLDIGRNSSGPFNDCYGAKPTYSCRRMSFARWRDVRNCILPPDVLDREIFLHRTQLPARRVWRRTTVVNHVVLHLDVLDQEVTVLDLLAGSVLRNVDRQDVPFRDRHILHVRKR